MEQGQESRVGGAKAGAPRIEALRGGRCTKQSFTLRPLGDSDVPEYSRLVYDSFNAWYSRHGWKRNYFACKPDQTAVFYDIYNDLTPGSSVAVFDERSGRMIGACFYHPREHHVSLGIMSVHKDYWGLGVGRMMVEHILKFTKDNGYKSCRLVGSAVNMDSFSLYNRCGFTPRCVYHDMVIDVPEPAMGYAAGREGVRDAHPEDAAAMGALELEISGIMRQMDYRYAIENPRRVLHAAVHQESRGRIDGFMISLRHPALNMLGPCVARSEESALSLISSELRRFKGTRALMVVPTDKRNLVDTLYKWGAVNVETHLKQVWGHFQPFKGVDMPSFLPETG